MFRVIIRMLQWTICNCLRSGAINLWQLSAAQLIAGSGQLKYEKLSRTARSIWIFMISANIGRLVIREMKTTFITTH